MSVRDVRAGGRSHACLSSRFSPIGYLATPFRDRFGIPRQPQLAPHARGQLRLLRPYDRAEAVRGLEAFSHVWLSFVFPPQCRQWSPTVRPPRLGGNARVGVFASRSPFRPNPLGLSLVELLAIDTCDGVLLTFGGVDLLDGTPVLDIKPYIPFVESEPAARAGFVAGPPPQLAVDFSAQAALQLSRHECRWPDLEALDCARCWDRIRVRPTPTIRCGAMVFVSMIWKSSGAVLEREPSSTKSRPRLPTDDRHASARAQGS
jgi:tRNA-Thr(GGU) m(6)t(6)A37 methyltransferase TsaA